jgi:hypothetical protein
MIAPTLLLNPTSSPYAAVVDTLVDNGYSVIPCMPGSKFPGRYQHKQWSARFGWSDYCDKLPTEFEIRIWKTWPDAGVCLVLDHAIKVIDIDTSDPQVRDALLAILPDSHVKKRGSKGFSAFYRGSKEIPARSFNVGGERALDLLAYGKQTVIPPSIHPDTDRPYVWTEGSDTLLEVPPDQLPELPDDIVEKIQAALEPFGYVPPVERDLIFGDADTAWREVNSVALQRLDDWVPHLGLPRLSRSASGYRAVAIFRPSGSGKSTEKRNLHLAIHNTGIKDWGDDDRSYTAIDLVMVMSSCNFQDAFEWLRDKLSLKPKTINTDEMVRRGLAKTDAKRATLRAPEDVAEEVTEPEKVPRAIRAPIGDINPFDHKTHGGIMGAVAKWMLECAWRPVPEFATIGTLGFCSALFGRRYTAPTGLALNLYLIGIAGPGFGKDHPLKSMQALMADAGLQHLVGPGDITSDSALEFVIRQRPCFVMPMDEIGVFLQATGGRNAGGYERRIRKVFLDLYTKGDGMWTGKQKVPIQGGKSVHDSAAEPVFCPTISIMGMSTPTEFYAGLTEANLSDGMVARMTIIATDKRPTPRDEREPVVPPKTLVNEVKKVTAAFPSVPGNIADNNWRTSCLKPKLHMVPWEGPPVRARWREIEDWQLGAIDADPSKDGIVSRAAEQTLKLATIRACSRSPDEPAVRLDDIEWGWALVSKSLWNIDAGVSKHMVGNDFERLCKDIVRYAEDAGGKIPKSVLLRKRGITKEPRMITAAFQHLAESGLIYPVPAGADRKTITLKTETEEAA